MGDASENRRGHFGQSHMTGGDGALRGLLAGVFLLLGSTIVASASPPRATSLGIGPVTEFALPARGALPEAELASDLRLASSPQQQRIPRQRLPKTAALQGRIGNKLGRGIGGASLNLRNLATNQVREISTNGEGVFRMLELPPGSYELKIEAEGYAPFVKQDLRLEAGEAVVIEVELQSSGAAPAPTSRIPRQPELGPPLPPTEPAAEAPYRELRRRMDGEPGAMAEQPEVLPPAEKVFVEMPDRWDIPMPEWDRYGRHIDAPYVKGKWWDPFNRRKLKGDQPVFGKQTFFNFTALSDTFVEGRRLPVPSNVSAARPGSSEFFGQGEQLPVSQLWRFSFDLFHGDASFRPIDWRIKVTPAINLNYLKTRELGIVNIDVREGKTRLDYQLSLQEAFVEVKLRDLGPNFDFVSVRAGIQGFNSDFRGFLFVEEQPGVRIFGNLHSNRIEYNLAYFHFLEKDTNSGLNTFERRHQQVIIANVYLQDFLRRYGYTAQFSVHYNKDDASLHFDENDFLVRPAPIGAVRFGNQLKPHNIRAAYLGWTGNGHFGRLNVSHAFYQALGIDDFNTIAKRRVTINVQMAALELSVDKDWMRFRSAFFFASGDANPMDGRARGFDTIVDAPSFAGGMFSLWNREGIRLTGSGVALTNPHSLLPSLRSNKEEGQANFVNPGIFIYNASADFELAPKLRGFVNFNFLRFHRTESLELLLFQAPIRHNIGVDYGMGVQYRPPLTENIVLTAGAAALSPGQGFRDIYTGKTLFSLFANLKLQF